VERLGIISKCDGVVSCSSVTANCGLGSGLSSSSVDDDDDDDNDAVGAPR